MRQWIIADSLLLTASGGYAFQHELDKHFANFTSTKKTARRTLHLRFGKVPEGDLQLGKDFEYDSQKKEHIFKKFRYARVRFSNGFFSPRQKKKELFFDKNFAFAGMQLLLENIIRDILTEEGFHMVHCSCLEKDGKIFFFPAFYNTGKTTMILHMLDNGYNFLADDRVLVHESGVVHHYAIPINLLSYNLKKYPGVVKEKWYKRISGSISNTAKPFLKKPTFINEAALFVLQEKFDSRFALNFKEVFPSSSLIMRGKPKAVYFLTRQKERRFTVKNISKEKATRLVDSVYYFEWECNWLRWLGGFNYFEQGILDYQRTLAIKRLDILNKFFSRMKKYEALVYPNFDAHKLLEKL